MKTIDFYKSIEKLIVEVEFNRINTEWFFFGLFWGVPENNKRIFSFRIPRGEKNETCKTE